MNKAKVLAAGKRILKDGKRYGKEDTTMEYLGFAHCKNGFQYLCSGTQLVKSKVILDLPEEQSDLDLAISMCENLIGNFSEKSEIDFPVPEMKFLEETLKESKKKKCGTIIHFKKEEISIDAQLLYNAFCILPDLKWKCSRRLNPIYGESENGIALVMPMRRIGRKKGEVNDPCVIMV